MALHPRRLAVMAALVIGTAVPVLADEIRQVQSGTVIATDQDSGVFFLSGSDFFVAAVGNEGIGTDLLLNASPGAEVPITSTWSGEQAFSNAIAAVDAFAGPVVLAGLIGLDAGSFIVPSLPAGSIFTLQRPFSLAPDSSLAGFIDSQLQMPVFSFGITGSGLATVTLNYGNSGPADARIEYRFSESQPAPIPEPSYMLMLGAATAGLLVAAWRRGDAAA